MLSAVHFLQQVHHHLNRGLQRAKYSSVRSELIQRMSWEELVSEAIDVCNHDSFLRDIVRYHILDHDSFGHAMSYNLSRTFAGIIPADRWLELFYSMYFNNCKYEERMDTLTVMGLQDLKVIRERDPASEGLVNPFMNFKGYKALQSHRLAHVLWRQGRKDTARAVQARCSEVFAVDIHPGAVIGE